MNRWPSVLMYHAVTDLPEDPNRISVRPERFGRHMYYLRRFGLRGVSLDQLVWATASGRARGLVGITFDDGYADLLHTALPVLERYGFSATVFALSRRLGDENRWDEGPRMRLLDVAELREVSERGVEIGSHGCYHLPLAGLAPERLAEEISGSRQELSEALGWEVRGFCYPYGSLDAAAARTVELAGYSYACSYKERVGYDLYDIPRVHAGDQDGPARLAMKLRGLTRYVDMLKARR